MCGLQNECTFETRLTDCRLTTGELHSECQCEQFLFKTACTPASLVMVDPVEHAVEDGKLAPLGVDIVSFQQRLQHLQGQSQVVRPLGQVVEVPGDAAQTDLLELRQLILVRELQIAVAVTRVDDRLQVLLARQDSVVVADVPGLVEQVCGVQLVDPEPAGVHAVDEVRHDLSGRVREVDDLDVGARRSVVQAEVVVEVVGAGGEDEAMSAQSRRVRSDLHIAQQLHLPNVLPKKRQSSLVHEFIKNQSPLAYRSETSTRS